MPRKNRAARPERANRRVQNSKPERMTVRWYAAIVTTPGFRAEVPE